MKRLIVLCMLLMVGLVFAADPPPVGIQTLFRTAPKPSPAGSMPRLVGMQGNTLVQLPLSSAKPALATTSTAGIVKVGSGLAILPDGTLNNTGIAGVASFAGRGGAVTPAPGDYSISQITGAATVAATGNYNDLTSKPVIPAAQVPADWNAVSGAAQILNKPTVPTALSQLAQDAAHRTVTDAEKATWNTVTASVNSVNSKTGTVTLTATDVGADPLGSATSVQTNLSAHTARTDNPHSVTKAQLGLGSVDNTSDAAKPVSTATQAALDLKANANALPANTSAVSHYFLTGYNSSTKAFSMAQPTFSDLLSPPTTLAGYGISDAYTKAFLDSALAGKLSDAPSDGNSYARKNGAWSPFVGGVQPFANISAALRANGIFTPSVTSVAQDGTHGIWMKNTVPYTGARTGGAIFHNMTTMNYCETDNNCRRFGSGNSSGGITQTDLNTALAAKANLASPALTGTPTAPTASGGTSSAQIATTAFVASAIASLGSGTIGGSTGSTADKVLTANGTGGSSAKASPTSIDPTTGAVTIPKQSGVPTLALFYNDSGTQTTGSGRIGPSGSMAKSYAFQDPNGIPGAGNVMVTGTAADQTTAAGTVAVIPMTAMALASGLYTPTYTAVTNASLTNVTAHYMRVGNEVEVKGTVQDNVVGGSTSFDISLPIASDLALVSDCTGLALSTDGGASNPILGVVTCNTTSDRVNVTLTNAGTSGGIYVRYNFTYTVK